MTVTLYDGPLDGIEIDVPIAALEFEAVAVPADDNFPGNRVFRYLVTDDIAKLKYDGPM